AASFVGSTAGSGAGAASGGAEGAGAGGEEAAKGPAGALATATSPEGAGAAIGGGDLAFASRPGADAGTGGGGAFGIGQTVRGFLGRVALGLMLLFFDLRRFRLRIGDDSRGLQTGPGRGRTRAGGRAIRDGRSLGIGLTGIFPTGIRLTRPR